MNSAQLSFLVGILANVITSIVYLSPVSTFRRIVKNRSTEEFESLPYILMLLNASLWTYYGFIKPDGFLVATVNGFGVIVLSFYLFLFLLFAPPKLKAKTAVLMAILNVSLVVVAIWLSRIQTDLEMQIRSIGSVCACFNIISYASPLAAMRTVVTTKSVEFMPFFLSFFLCMSGFIWAVYAFLIRDYFIGVPNGTGFVLGACQLVLYSAYRNWKPSKCDLEEGWQHEPFILS